MIQLEDVLQAVQHLQAMHPKHTGLEYESRRLKRCILSAAKAGPLIPCSYQYLTIQAMPQESYVLRPDQLPAMVWPQMLA
jgi:hypothetical protein